MTHEQEKKLGDDVKPGTDQSGENLCPTCAGKGKVGNKPCPNCGGTGTVTTLVGGLAWPDRAFGPGSVRLLHGGWCGELPHVGLQGDRCRWPVAQRGVRSHLVGVVLPCANHDLRLP
jgi:hypothetical protein